MSQEVEEISSPRNMMKRGMIEQKSKLTVTPFNVDTEASISGYSLIVHIHQAAEEDRRY